MGVKKDSTLKIQNKGLHQFEPKDSAPIKVETPKRRAGGGCSYTNRVNKLCVFPVWGRYVHGFLAQVILFTLEPIRIFPSSLSFHYLFTRGPRFGQENATGEDRPQKMNVHDFQLSPSVD